MVEQREEVKPTIESFEALNLKPDLLRGIYAYGFEKPSLIQSKGILPVLNRRDIIAQAQSGTGKTATFAISILQLIDQDAQKCQALVLVPNREFAQQIHRVIMCLGEYLKVSVHICTGGTNIMEERKKLQEGVQIVVGTPGRVLDMIKRGFLKTDHLKLFVLDEADEMLGRGFQDQIQDILKGIPDDVQILLFSTTMPHEILALTNNLMRDPVTILLKNEELIPDNIKHFYISIDKEVWKFDTLVKLYNNIDFQQCIIYCNKKQKVDELTIKLREKNFNVSNIHESMDQNQRDFTIKEFRTGTSRVLITTDLLARGIDIQQVSLVINFDLPLSKEKYIHRVGRSGRFGDKGVAINFVTPSDEKFLQEIAKYSDIEVVNVSPNLKIFEMSNANLIETTIESFEALNLKPDLLRGIYAYGFEKPSLIQSKGILPGLNRRDIIAQAQSGTGKTATFAISILQLIDQDAQKCQALVLVPNRELAQQIHRVIMCLGEYLKVSVHICTGGTNIMEERKKLQEGVQIVVGTPGRVLDMIKRGFLKTDHLKLFVLDEADEMLGRGFQDQIQDILKGIPDDVQISLFSTTMPHEILALTNNFMRDPVTILLKNEELIPENIKHFYISIDKEEWKFDTLVELYNNIDCQQCIIYCNKKQKVDELTTKLKEMNFNVSNIHESMDQNQRDFTIKEFRTGTSRVLITTDLLARGIDIHQVSLVINLDLPLSKEKYIHRVGRSGRCGDKGVAINFVTPTDYKFLQEIEKYYTIEVVEMPLDVSNIFD